MRNVYSQHLIIRQPQMTYQQTVSQFYDAECREYGISVIYRIENHCELFECVADACADIYLYYNKLSGECGLDLVGPHDNFENIVMHKGFTYLIIRFMPGFNPFKNIKISDIKGSILSLYDYAKYRTFLDQIVEYDDFPSQCSTILKFMAENYRRRTDSISTTIELIADFFADDGARYSVRDMEMLVGYSSRYMNKILTENVGYSIHSLSSIMRVQMVADFLSKYGMLSHPILSYADLATRFGYCDQSHMIREFKRYFNMTPKTYLERYCR